MSWALFRAHFGPRLKTESGPNHIYAREHKLYIRMGRLVSGNYWSCMKQAKNTLNVQN